MWLNRTAAPAQAVSTADAKAHLRVLTADEDTLIDGIVQAATGHLEGRRGITGRAFVTQAWEYRVDRFPAGGMALELPFPPLRSVTEVRYVAEDGSDMLLPATVYEAVPETYRGAIRLRYGESWPATRAETHAVRVAFQAGYGTPVELKAEAPEAVQAILLLLGHWFRNREAVVTGTISTEVEMAVEALVGNLKVRWT